MCHLVGVSRQPYRVGILTLPSVPTSEPELREESHLLTQQAAPRSWGLKPGLFDIPGQWHPTDLKSKPHVQLKIF